MTPTSQLPTALEILKQVRNPQAIYLTNINIHPEQLSADGEFVCSRAKRFPNTDIFEITGGQIHDVMMQMAYVLNGLLIRQGINLLGLDYNEYKQAINAHQFHLVRSEVSYLRPCLIDRVFTVHAALEKMPNGGISAIREKKAFVKVAFVGKQSNDGDSSDLVEVFRARAAASIKIG